MLYFFCLAIILAALIWEAVCLRRARSRLPVRIHVHGSRGKSSVTNLIAKLLRDNGVRVVSKTTGDLPLLTLPDGSVTEIRRYGPARINEQIRIIKQAATLGAEALVVEGMALHPETIWQTGRILDATLAVITNTRPDHAESMGQGRAGVIQTLSLLIPTNAALLTSDEAGCAQLQTIALQNNSRFSAISGPWASQPQLLALEAAKQACSTLGRECEFSAATFDAALLNDLCTELDLDGTRVLFCDLLSANDLESSQLLWSALIKQRHLGSDWAFAAILATRADRPLRSRAFVDWLIAEFAGQGLVLTGDHAPYAWLRARRLGGKATIARGRQPERLLSRLTQVGRAGGKNKVVLVAFGNLHGTGQKLRAFVQSAAKEQINVD